MSETTIRSPTKHPSSSGSVEKHEFPFFRDISQERLKYLAACWKQNDYVVVEDALTDEAIEMLDTGITYDNNLAKHDPVQFYRTHNDPSSDPTVQKFFAASTAYYSKILATALEPAYTFAMRYSKNSDMDPHFDSFNNPVSSTVCYRFSPSDASNPIFFDRAYFNNPHTHRVTVRDRDGIPSENVVEINLKAGDLAVFRGRNHLHWRKRIVDELDYRAVLLHFFDYRYKGEALQGTDSIPFTAHHMVDFDSYDEFRRKYVMYFDTNATGWT